MRPLVDFGLTSGSSFPSGYLVLGSATRGVLGTNTLAPANTFADYSGRLQSLQVSHQATQAAGPLVEYSARTAAVTLTNDDGTLDPYVLEQAGLNPVGSIMRLRLPYNGSVYPVFYGLVDSWVPDRSGPDTASVTITASDGFSLLEAQQRTALAAPIGAGQTTGARVNAILDAAGWPAGDRSIATGNSTLQATDMDGTPLNELQEVAKNEVGEFYIQPDGIAYFRNRQALLTDTRSATSQATFGTNTAGGELMYVGKPGFSWDRSQLTNVVRATIAGGTQQVATDASSVARWGVYAYEQDLALQTDAEAMLWATYVLTQDKKPSSRFTSLTVECQVDPDNLVPQALGRRFGDRITVVRRVPGGVTDARQVFIRSVEHQWTADRPMWWQTTWGLDDASGLPFFVVGSSSNGVLGTNALSY